MDVHKLGSFEDASDDEEGENPKRSAPCAEGHQVSLPMTVQNFVSETIDSVGTLELLLLLYRMPEREWCCQDIAAEMCVKREWVQSQIQMFVRAGLSCESGRHTRSYRYYPSSMEMNAAVAELARTYADRPLAVISFIHSRPAAALRRFAEAFRSRGHESDG